MTDYVFLPISRPRIPDPKDLFIPCVCGGQKKSIYDAAQFYWRIFCGKCKHEHFLRVDEKSLTEGPAKPVINLPGPSAL